MDVMHDIHDEYATQNTDVICRGKRHETNKTEANKGVRVLHSK